MLIEFAEYEFDGPVEVFRAVDGEGGEGFGGEDVEVSHGFGGGVELLDDGFAGAAALAHVAVDAAHEANVVGGVDVDAEVVERGKFGVVEGEDAFDEDEPGGGDEVEGVGDAGVRGEVVYGAVDGVAGGEGADVLDEELGLEGVGVVEVALAAVVEGELREVAVVEVEGEERGVELMREFGGEGGLSGAGTAADADDDGLGWEL